MMPSWFAHPNASPPPPDWEHGDSLHAAPQPQPRVAMIQDGARLHYAVPLALQRGGHLRLMFSEWFVRPRSWQMAVAWLLKKIRPGLAARLAGRSCPELASEACVQNLPLVIRQGVARRRLATGSTYYAWSAAQVARWVERHGWADANVLLGFIRNLDPDLVAAARRAGLLTVGDQIIAPAAVEIEQAHLEQQRWPDWQAPAGLADLEPYRRWERLTWEQLDHITCASDYVRQGLLRQGVDDSRISVLPYPIDPVGFPQAPRLRQPNQPLTVGFVGAVNLRKGAPWFFQVAREICARRSGRPVRFVMLGPVRLSDWAIQKHQGQVELPGPVPRQEMPARLAQFDIFFFPSTCEGSAGAVMEAMCSGLPIVTSPHSGSVVAHGREGFVHPYDDVPALTQSLLRLLEDEDLRREMGAAAAAKARTFNLDWYSRELSALLRKLLQNKSI